MSRAEHEQMSEEEFRAAAREFLAANAKPRETVEARWGEGSDRVGLFRESTPEEDVKELAEAREWRAKCFDAGFVWASGPVDYGGRGLPRSFDRIWVGLEGGFDVPTGANLFLVGLGMVAPTLLAHGKEQAKQRYLRALWRGDLIGCQLFSEPEAGSDLANIKTRAVRDGDEWVVNGQKVWTSGAHYSDLGILLTRTSVSPDKRHHGLTMFLVDMASPGIEIRPLRQMTGGTSFNEVFLTDVRLPDWHRLGDVDKGWRVAMTTLMNERAAIGGGSASSGFSTTRRLFELARHTGANEDPAVRQQLAQLWIRSQITRYSRLRAAAHLRAGHAPGPENSIAKLFLVQTQSLMVEIATAACGPKLAADAGEWGTYAWAEFVLGAPSGRIGGGTDEIQKNILAERMLGLPPVMTLDPRTPVIVGVAQTLRRPDPAEATEPVEMMVEALRLAAADSHARRSLLERADSIRVPKVVSWPYTDPGALVAARLGAAPVETVYCTDGGNTPQVLVSDAAAGIAEGRHHVVLIVGAEGTYTRHRARKHGVWLQWPKQQGARPARTIGEPLPGVSEAEADRGVEQPIQIYPILETAVRAARGTPVAAHRTAMAELWSRFSAVAAGNPHAWSPHRREPVEILTPTPANRMVGFPYTKALCAYSDTDQAAALILCSVEAARDAGVPEDRWVFPWTGADAHDHWFLSERADLHSSPALRAVGQAAFATAGIGIDDVAHLDLYACFPVAVEVAAAELRIALDDATRTPTVTGGNAFAGSPGNNYVTHALATMVETLRNDPGSIGLVTGVGWYLTKHAGGLYSTAPPPGPFRRSRPQAEVDRLPRRPSADGFAGDATIETYTVMHDRDGAPSVGLVACLTADGRRAWTATRKPDALAAMTTEDLCGVGARVDGDGTLEFG